MNTKKKGGESVSQHTREQEIESFVNREIYACQTALIEEVLKRHIITVDEIENLYRPFDGELVTPNICIDCKESFPFLDSESGLCESCYENEQQPQVIYEWWLVSAWFGRKLLLAGEPVLENGYGIWWGRTTTGQVIAMDYVIEKIYEDIVSK